MITVNSLSGPQMQQSCCDSPVVGNKPPSPDNSADVKIVRHINKYKILNRCDTRFGLGTHCVYGL